MKLLNQIGLGLSVVFLFTLLVLIPNTYSRFAKRDLSTREMSAIGEMDKLKEFTSELIFQFSASHAISLSLLLAAGAIAVVNCGIMAANLLLLDKAGANRETRQAEALSGG